jgi:hypothetical protein
MKNELFPDVLNTMIPSCCLVSQPHACLDSIKTFYLTSTNSWLLCDASAKTGTASDVGRSDTDKGWTLKESHTYEKRPTKMQQASHNQTKNKILSHFYHLI